MPISYILHLCSKGYIIVYKLMHINKPSIMVEGLFMYIMQLADIISSVPAEPAVHRAQ